MPKLFLDKSKILEIDRIEDRATKIFAAACFYASSGFYVVPLRPDSNILPGVARSLSSNEKATKNVNTVEKWFGPGGEFEGYNIGLSCGKEDGIVALDVDVKKGKQGIESLAALLGDEKLEAPTQRTTSGGFHHIFQWTDYCGNSVEKLGPGLDTRGGTAESCKGHIAVWPSSIEGIEYEWIAFGEVPPAPKWLTDGLGVPAYASLGRGNENVSAEDLNRKLSIPEIIEMLNLISIEDLSYEEWLAIGQSIQSQIPDHKGLKLWDNWSKEGSRYENGECAKRWNGFNENGAIQGGTLIHFAKQYGWIPDKPIRNAQHIDIIEEMNKTFAVVMTGGKVRVLAEIKDGNPFSPSHQLMTKEDLNLLMANQKLVTTDNRGNIKTLPKSQVWLSHEDRRSFPNGITFKPGKPKEFSGMYNLWEGFQVEPLKTPCPNIYKYIKEIICENNEVHYEWLLDWIADCIQDPANPKGCAVVMRGKEGAGKGTLGQIMSRIFGIHYKHVVHERHLVGNFNSHLANAVVVFADEVLYGGSKKISGAIKSLVTEKQLTIERKGLDADSYQNCCHLLIASNEDWFIPAGPQSRRWFVLEVSNDMVGNKKYFDELHNEIHGPALQGFLYDMQHRDIKSNLTRAPETQLLLEQRAMASSTDPIVEWWTDCVERAKLPVVDGRGKMDKEWPDTVIKVDLYDTFKKWSQSNGVRYSHGSGHFYEKMKKFGFKEARLSQPRGDRVRCLTVPMLKTSAQFLLREAGVFIDREEDVGIDQKAQASGS